MKRDKERKKERRKMWSQKNEVQKTVLSRYEKELLAKIISLPLSSPFFLFSILSLSSSCFPSPLLLFFLSLLFLSLLLRRVNQRLNFAWEGKKSSREKCLERERERKKEKRFKREREREESSEREFLRRK